MGGLATLQVLSWLARDPETRVIGLVSKAPSAAVAEPVRGAVIGALLYERLAETSEEAERLAA